MKFDFSNEIKVEDNIFMAWCNNADAYVWYNTAQEKIFILQKSCKRIIVMHMLYFFCNNVLSAW